MRTRLLVPALVCLAAPAAAQVVSGRVTGGAGTPVAAAKVRLVGAAGDTLAVLADAAGRFRLEPAPGRFHLAATAQGLRAVVSPAFELARGDSLELRVRMFADSVSPRPLEVVAAARRPPGWVRAFHRRAGESAFGWYVTRERIDRATAFRTSDLLRGAPGITLVPGRPGFGYLVRGPGGCLPAVYLDGMRVRGGSAVDEWTRPMELEGIEVYAIGGAPAELGGPGGSCIVLALWSRAGW
ncbi:MAG TPA: carboxypeptidase regulatory-like domain-containing protein [Longimicrobium sp.]|nr:carboxypeptidase regulatory-like domain-containing protein [Longimicrobium sp.]